MAATNTQAVRRKLIALAVGLGLLLLPALYPLSAGPAIWLVDRGWMDGWTYVSVYRPLMNFAYGIPCSTI
jgi:hypothetical protein